MASAGPAAADRIDRLPRWRAALADRLPQSKKGKPASSRAGAAGRCLLHDAATAASAGITQHVARAGSSMRRCGQEVQVMAVPRIPRAATPGATCGRRCIALDTSSSALFWRRLRGRTPSVSQRLETN
jgi:hypothetical protein